MASFTYSESENDHPNSHVPPPLVFLSAVKKLAVWLWRKYITIWPLSLNRSMVFYVNIYIASLNVYILQLIKLKKRDYMVFEIEFCVWIVQKTTVLHTAEWLTKEKESSCRRVDREKTTLIRSRRCSVANTSSSRLATFFMVYTIVINYTFELIINWHRFCFWKISNSNILYNKRIKSIFLRFKNIYFFKKIMFFFVFF